MNQVKEFETLNSEDCVPGTYVITTVNGSDYEIEVRLDAATTMKCIRDAVLRDPDQGVRSLRLYGDGDVIPVLVWSAMNGELGAVFIFYAEEARQCDLVEDYHGTFRRTSAVTSIQQISST